MGKMQRGGRTPIKDRVLYEDNHYIGILKEVGELVQGDQSEDVPLLDEVREFIRKRDKKPGEAFAQLVHRVDRPVGGVVLFAKTSKGVTRANEMFRDQAVHRVYWAITEEQPPELEGELVGWLTRNAKQNKSYISTKRKKDSKLAELSYRLVAKSVHYSLLEVELKTGRHHQIRAQLAHAGCIIRGDLKYGAKRSLDNGGISLFARELRFTHPIRGEEIRIVANPPIDPLWDLFPRG